MLGIDGDGKLHVEAVPQDLRGVALVVALQDGGKPAFDIAEKHLRASEDAIVRGQLLGALGSVRDPALAARARALVFQPDLLRRNELTTVAEYQVDEPALRPVVRQWLDANFAELQKRLAPAGAELVGIYADGMCSDEEATTLRHAFEQRMQDVEGGPLELKQTAESVHLCSAQKAARTGLPLQVPGR